MDEHNVLSRSADCGLLVESYYKLIIIEKLNFRKDQVALSPAKRAWSVKYGSMGYR
jgi:hypothetical protein